MATYKTAEGNIYTDESAESRAQRDIEAHMGELTLAAEAKLIDMAKFAPFVSRAVSLMSTFTQDRMPEFLRALGQHESEFFGAPEFGGDAAKAEAIRKVFETAAAAFAKIEAARAAREEL